jgi:hypothetical protein
MSEPAEIRRRLLAGGFSPLPLVGKRPILKNWQTHGDVSELEIDSWTKRYPAALNTGILTRFVPVLDLDIGDAEAAAAVEALVRERVEEIGFVLIRFGRFPRRAIPFRTDAPFPKIVAAMIAPEGSSGQKLEFLCDGQQLVVDGVHPDTGQPYTWHGGELGQVKRDDLPTIHEQKAQALVAAAAQLLVERFGYRSPATKPRAGAGADDGEPRPADWSFTPDDLIDHDRLAALAMRLVRSGMNAGACVNFLRANVEALANIDDDRRQRRVREIPGMVEGARTKFEAAAPQQPPRPPNGLAEVAAVFNKWLVLKDLRPVYAVLGAAAATLMPGGDPVWLIIVAPPSTAKTEIINALARVAHVRAVDDLSKPALLSGTPKYQKGRGATGGLLREVGDVGVLTLKDFGSVLSLRPDVRAEVLASLRRIYDGEWTRNIGSDGGKTLAWRGRVGLISGATQAYDDYYKAISQLGDRFLVFRLDPAPGVQQFRYAFDHTGEKTKQMRKELAERVAGLFVDVDKRTPRRCDNAERDRLADIVKLAVYLRGHVEREGYTHEIVNVHRPEGPGRLGLMLERLLVGLDAIGLAREEALALVEAVAMDGCPPLRRQAYFILLHAGEELKTRAIADRMGLPTMTARRVLEDLAAQGLALRRRGKKDADEDEGEKKGAADFWRVDPDWGKSWEK